MTSAHCKLLCALCMSGNFYCSRECVESVYNEQCAHAGCTRSAVASHARNLVNTYIDAAWQEPHMALCAEHVRPDLPCISVTRITHEHTPHVTATSDDTGACEKSGAPFPYAREEAATTAAAASSSQ